MDFGNFVLSNYLLTPSKNHWIFALVVAFLFTFSGYGQKSKGGSKRSKDIIPVVYCVKNLGNGIYQASFGYENPGRKEVVIDENGSIIKWNNGKKVAKGLNKFKSGSHDKVFTKEFGAKDYVEWTINSNGNSHTVIANANSAKKCEPEDGFIFPVIGNGKSYDIIGQELTSLCEGVAGEEPSKLIFQLNGAKVLVEIVPKEGERNAVIGLLKSSQFSVLDTDFLLFKTDVYTDLDGLAAIDVYMTQGSVCLLNSHADIINFARPVYPAKIDSGGVISQGDSVQTSNRVRESFRWVNAEGKILPVDGTGIKIGVMSDSYDMELGEPTYASRDVNAKELPEDVDLLLDNSFKATDEGRAMMQIIHDVAPGAQLAFHTATASPRQFEVGFNALKDANCDIIVDDITFITEPFFGTGRISRAIQNFTGQPGKFHFTSAGNIANKGYQNIFSASSGLPVTNFIPQGSPTRAHVFGTNIDGSEDYLQEISVVPGTYLIALQWKEDLASQINNSGANDDLDIYVLDDLGRLLVGSNRVNIAGDPTEIIVFRSTGTGTANLLITNADGPTTVPFRYIAFRTSAADGTPDGLQFEEYFNNGAPTVSGHAMTPESVTVGAVDYRKGTNPVAEVFSSYAGILKDGTQLEVDMYAPDGGNTTTSIGQFANCDTCDKDEFKNFYGTSAAAPHAAAAMALLQSALPSWFPDGSFTSTTSIDVFKNTGTTFNAPDGSTGSFINTLEAFKSIASQTARITELKVEDGKVPSAEPFTVTILGEFFPTDPEKLTVLFDGAPLENVQIVEKVDGKTEITATVGTFSGNPELVVVTESETPGGTDGGPSDPAYFFDEGKIALTIIPDNAVFEYGQDISLSYRVEGLPEGTDLTKTYPEIIEALGLPEVILDAQLEDDEFPIVYSYPIEPSFGGEDYDHDLFQINFISGYNDPELGKVGYLTITKKDLVITTENMTYTYGDAIELPLVYEYNEEGITETALFYNTLSNSHASDFRFGLPNKFQAVVSKFQAVVSGYELLDLLAGGSWSASERTIQNKFQAVVSNMSIINLENENFTNYIAANELYESGTTSKFQAVVSKFQAVVSAEDLFSGVVEIGEVNKFQAVVSKFQAVVSTDDPDRPFSGYDKVFTIVDAEDAPPENGSDEERSISELYALNLITGLDVTDESESHHVYPGAFLNAMSANFNITYESGDLIILPRDLSVKTENINISYGDVLTKEQVLEKTVFEGWAFEGEFMESIATYFEASDEPFEFEKDGVTYQISELSETGDYKIKLKNIRNYNIQHTYDDSFGTLSIDEAVLTVSIDDLIITQGDIPVFISSITGFAEGESVNSVFPNGVIPYYTIIDNVEYDFNDAAAYENLGAFDIRIREPENYVIEYAREGTLLVNPTGDRKLRTYADCVTFVPNDNGLNYKVIFRYENENDDPVYVFEGPDNYIAADGQYAGTLPTTFMPGSGTFEMLFDGSTLTWNLRTFGTLNKSSVSSANNDGTGECEAKIDGSYLVYPNPVSSELTIEQNVSEISDVFILNMYGVVVDSRAFDGSQEKITVNVSGYTSGMYIIRIISQTGIRTFSIIKE